MTYWTRGRALYRVSRRPEGGFTAPERWDGLAWLPWPALVGDLLDGDTTLEEITEAKARKAFPDAF